MELKTIITEVLSETGSTFAEMQRVVKYVIGRYNHYNDEEYNRIRIYYRIEEGEVEAKVYSADSRMVLRRVYRFNLRGLK